MKTNDDEKDEEDVVNENVNYVYKKTHHFI